MQDHGVVLLHACACLGNTYGCGEGGDANVFRGLGQHSEGISELGSLHASRGQIGKSSGNTAEILFAAGLVDELIVEVNPVVFGEGKPLFGREVDRGGRRWWTRCASTAGTSSRANACRAEGDSRAGPISGVGPGSGR